MRLLITQDKAELVVTPFVVGFRGARAEVPCREAGIYPQI